MATHQRGEKVREWLAESLKCHATLTASAAALAVMEEAAARIRLAHSSEISACARNALNTQAREMALPLVESEKTSACGLIAGSIRTQR